MPLLKLGLISIIIKFKNLVLEFKLLPQKFLKFIILINFQSSHNIIIKTILTILNIQEQFSKSIRLISYVWYTYNLHQNFLELMLRVRILCIWYIKKSIWLIWTFSWNYRPKSKFLIVMIKIVLIIIIKGLAGNLLKLWIL